MEIDPELAARLRERFADAPSVEIVDGDATALQYPDEKFTGAACFTMLHHVPTGELQDRLFAEVARVLRPGAALVASDSLGSEDLAATHEDDTYNPVDPQTLPERLAAAGFAGVEVKTNEFGWAAIARKGLAGSGHQPAARQCPPTDEHQAKHHERGQARPDAHRPQPHQ